MHEPIFENIFSDDRRSIGLSHQRHVLRLHVGGKAWILLRYDIGRTKVHRCCEVLFDLKPFQYCAGFTELFNDAAEVYWVGIEQVELAIRYRSGHEKRSRLRFDPE